jgi:guanosine-3',5'-bis(diphosphate) 3'-pyrophosphohydrolase
MDTSRLPVHVNNVYIYMSTFRAGIAACARENYSLTTSTGEAKMDDKLLLIKAIHFAADKHRDQRRKDVRQSPYINHPIYVAEILATIGGVNDTAVLVAAILHDTIEDTETTASEIETLFGAKITRIVEEVTDDKSLPWEERKKQQVEHARTISPEGALVKLADKTANIQDVAHNPPDGWSEERRREYLAWAEEVVNNLPEVSSRLKAEFEESLAHAHRVLNA